MKIFEGEYTRKINIDLGLDLFASVNIFLRIFDLTYGIYAVIIALSELVNAQELAWPR